MKVIVLVHKPIGAVLLLCSFLVGCGSPGNTSSSGSSQSATSSSNSSASVVLNPTVPINELIYAVNAGSTVSETLYGVDYQPDNFVVGGALSSTSDPISAIADGPIYQTERYGDSTYNFPVTNSRYSVLLHIVEMFHTTTASRSFNVYVEDKLVLSNLDLYLLVGHDTAFDYLVEDVQVNDGLLTIRFETILDNATVSGIAIYSDAGGKSTQ